MRTWIALLVVLALIAAALVFGLGLLDKDGETDPAGPATEGDPTPSEEGTSEEGPGDEEVDPRLRPTSSEPPDMPALEAAAVREPIGVLMLAGVPQRFNLFLAQQLDAHPLMSVRSWVAPVVTDPQGAVPPGDVLPGLLDTAPRGVTLDDEDIDVVVVHDLDPATLDRDFWLEVVKRVGEGRLGLLVIPGIASGRKMLDHDVLAAALPVAKAAAIEGQPLPGTFRTLAAYVPTDAGVRHPASRLVTWPTWSRRIWNSRALVETPWGTKVCYPVEEVGAGASVLLDAKPADAESLPALIAGVPDKGRVLWFGGWDLGGRHAYGRPNVVTDWQILVRNWATWLAGQVED